MEGTSHALRPFDTPAASAPGEVAAEVERLRELAALHEASAALHAANAARLSEIVERDHLRLSALRGSLSWRITFPLRLAGLAVRAIVHPLRAYRAALRALRGRGLRTRLRRVLREEGLRVTAVKSLILLRNLSLHALRFVAIRLGQTDDRLRAWGNFLSYRGRLTREQIELNRARLAATIERSRETENTTTRAMTGTLAPARLFAPSVLIIGELSLPQCAKYRVWQKQEHLASLGIACTVRDWTHFDAARDALQLCAMVIFYRVPGHPSVLALYNEARRLGLEVIWDVDDLIFDERLYLADRDLASLDPEIRRGVLAGAALYHRALNAADRGIASTAALAALMQAAGPARVDLVENALDADTIAAADALLALRAQSPANGDAVQIVYGSGSRTHDGDFAVAAPALTDILARYPQVSLRVVGELHVPPALSAFGARVEHLPQLRFREYLALLARADINLAPLEDTPFNSAKSNIKFVEAAILAIPSVCTPTANFAAAIDNGINGYLPADTAQWTASLEALVRDPALRTRMGLAARARVLERYAPASIAAAQLGPLVAPLRTARAADLAAGRLRVLAVHRRLYPPHASGATMRARIAIETLAAHDDVALSVFTAEDIPNAPPYALRRLTDRAVPVVAMRPPRRDDPAQSADDPTAARRFAAALDAIRPEIVWLHDLHGLGAGLARLCHARAIPYALDLDATWWRPEPDNADERRDDRETPPPLDPALTDAVIRGALRHASRLIAPTEAIAHAAIVAGADAGRVVILPPGVESPAQSEGPDEGPLRFGYAGTEEGELVLRCFRVWNDADFALVLVDHAQAEGRRALLPVGRNAKRCKVIAPFGEAGRDAFFASIDVLLYPGDDPLAPAQIVREAIARGVHVAAAGRANLPPSPLITRLDASGFADPSRPDAGTALRDALAPLLSRTDTIRAERRRPELRAVLPEPSDQAVVLRDILESCLPSAAAV